jgi:hypothetical protein
MATDDFSGAGFLVGGLVGGSLNQADELERQRNASLGYLEKLREYQDTIEEWTKAGSNMVAAQVRLKADYAGMQALIAVLIGTIQEHSKDRQVLSHSYFDSVAGEASRIADEKYKDNIFALQISRRVGMLAIINACVQELSRIAPHHRLMKQDERFIPYWTAFKGELTKRDITPRQIRGWGQEMSRVEQYMEVQPEYFVQSKAAWANGSAKS